MLKAGYLNNTYGPWQHKKIKISEAAQNGYNTIVLAFANLKPNTKMTFCDDQFLAYTDWDNFSNAPQAITAMKNDIAMAKTKYGLKHVLVSVGGASQSFRMGDPETMAQNVVNFLNKYNFDGIDFDLEQQVDPQQLDALIWITS
jgi:chitinase